MNFDPNDPDATAHERIAAQLRCMILRGSFAPAEQLPNEHRLMAHFDVSRATIRGAVAMLASEGLIRVCRPFGTEILNWRRGGSTALFEPMVCMDHGTRAGADTLQEMFWLRRNLYRGIPELLVDRDVELDHAFRHLDDLRQYFRYPLDIPSRQILLTEELLLTELAEVTQNTPCALLANSLRRALKMVILLSSTSFDVTDSQPLFIELFDHLKTGRHADAEHTFDRIVRLREPAYLHFVSMPSRERLPDLSQGSATPPAPSR